MNQRLFVHTILFLALCILPNDSSGALPTVGFQVEVYADVTDPSQLAFDSDGTLYTGRDNTGSGGGFSDPVKIHQIGFGGLPVIEYGNTTIADPDVVVVDQLGLVSGTPGTVLVGGNAIGHNGSPVGGSLITAIAPDESISTLIHVPLGPGGGDVNGLAFDSSGRLFFSTDSAVYVATDTNASVFSTLGGIRPQGIDIDSDDNVYVRGEDDAFRKYDSMGNLLSQPFSSSGNIAISSGGPFGQDAIYTIEEGELRFIDDSGQKFRVGTGFGNSSNNPAFGPDGSLFVGQFQEDRVLRIFAPPVPEPTTVSLAFVMLLSLMSRRKLSHF